MKTFKIVFAKFKIRKVRLLFGLALMTLLFSALIAGSILLFYGYKGIAEYATDGLGGRYFASFNNMLATSLYQEDRDVIADAQRIYEKEKAEKCVNNEECEYEKAEYPFTEYEDGSKSVRINTSAGEQAIENKIKKINNYPESTLNEILSDYTYRQKLKFQYYLPKDSGWFYSLIDGEKINDVVKSHGGDVLEMAAYNTTFSAGDIFNSYRFDNVDVKKDEIPIFITESHAEAILNKKGIKIGDSGFKKTILLREKMNGQDGSFTMCYRNGSSIEHVSSAITVDKERESEFSLLAGECQGVTSKNGIDISADRQTVVKFRVVGIYAQRNIYDAIDEDDLLGNIFKSGLSFSYFVIDSERISPSARIILRNLWEEPTGWQKYSLYKDSYIVEFDKSEDVERIIADKDCQALQSSICTGERPFVITKYGNSSIFLKKLKDRIVVYAIVVMIISFALLEIIMINTLNRILCDSRKETAILRAIGYTRKNIAMIYVKYAFIYATIVGIISFVIGNLLSFIIDIVNRNQYNSYLMVNFGVFENLNAPLYSFNIITIICPVIIILLGLLSVLLPLYLNTRRHIAKDLREE